MFGQYNLTAQVVGASGSLIGPRISLNAAGVPPGAVPIFDGTNYFLVWLDFNGNLKGQLIDATGTLAGTSVLIASGVSMQWTMPFKIDLSDLSYLVAFIKTDGYLYGQRVSKTGSLLGGQIQISTTFAREISSRMTAQTFSLCG